MLVLRQVLMSRIGDQVERELTAEIESLDDVSALGDPRDGSQFSNVGELFDAFLSRTAAPADGAVVTFVGGEPYDAKVSDPAEAVLAESFDDLATVSEPTTGAHETPLGESRYIAIPVTIGDSTGVLVAASLTASERDQVESAVRIAIENIVLLLASLFIWLAAGRAIVHRRILEGMAFRESTCGGLWNVSRPRSVRSSKSPRPWR